MQFTNKEEYFQYVAEFKNRYSTLRADIVKSKIAIKDAMSDLSKIPLEYDKWGYATHSSRYKKRQKELTALAKAIHHRKGLSRQMADLILERAKSRKIAGEQMRSRLRTE